MATEVKRRRGTTTQHSTFTGAEGEITVDLTKDTLVVHDGSTQAGFPLLREDFSNAPAEIDVQNSTIEASEFIGDLRGAVRFRAKAVNTNIAKGDAVYISGISGNTPTVGLADADNASKMPAFGLAAADINENATGEIITFGTLSGVDTSSFSVGDILYIDTSPSIGSTLTATAPAGESAQIQNIGKVQRSDATVGSIKVGGAGRSNATPNLNQDKIFLGDSNNRAVSTALSSIGLTSFNDDSTFLKDADFGSNGLMKRTSDGVYTTITDSSSNWDAAYTYSQVGHLPLTGGTLTNSLTINVGSPQLILRDSTDDDDQSILFRTNGDVDLYSITGASDVLNIKTLTSRAMKFFTNDTLAMTIDTDGSIDTEQGLDVGGTLKLESVAQDTAATSALVWAYDGSQTVKYRTLGSNAFNSTTIPTNNNQLTNGAGYITQTDGDARYLQLTGGTISSNLIISGNLTVSGTTTTINTETINLADNIILLNSNFGGQTPTESAGIEIERGADNTNKQFLWNETNDRWQTDDALYVSGALTASGDLSVTGGDITLGTDSIASNINSVGDVLVLKVDSNENTGGSPNIQFKVGAATELTINGSTATFAGDVSMVDGNASGKFAVKSAGVHASYDLYNDGTSYFNGGVIVDAGFTQSGGAISSFSGAVNIAGKLTLDSGSLTNGIINTPASLRINIDSDNNNTGEKFVIGHNQDSINNNNELFVVNESGNVGIGTSSIDGTLHLDAGTSSDLVIEKDDGGYASVRFHNAGSQVSYIQLDASEDMIYYGGSGVNQIIYAGGSERLRIDSSGRIGVGVTPESSWTTWTPIQIGQASTFAGRISVNQTDVANNWYYDGAEKRINSGYAQRYVQDSSGDHYWLTAGTSTADSTITFSTPMIIKNSGNVGIGITTPQTTLQVNGTASSLNAHFGQGTNNSNGVYGGISLGYSEGANAGYRKVAIVAQAKGDTAARQDLHFLVDTANDSGSAGIADSKMMIAYNTGNVGIGTTSPASELDVEGTIQANNLKLQNLSTGSSDTTVLTLDAGQNVNVRTLGSNAFDSTSYLPLTGGTLTGDLKINLNTNAQGNFVDNIGEVGSGNFCLQVSNSAENALKPLGFRAEKFIFATGDLLVGKTSSGIATVGVELKSDGNLVATRQGVVASLNREDSDGDVLDIRKDTTTVGTLGNAGADLFINSSGSKLLFKVAGTTEATLNSNYLLVSTSNENVYNGTTTGTAIGNGYIFSGRSADAPIYANRIGNDGNIIRMNRDGTGVGAIGVESSDNLFIQALATNGTGLTFPDNNVVPRKNGSNSDNGVDLGHPSVRWQDFYLGGNAYIDGDVQFGGNTLISTDTSDASDNAQIIISGGGASGDTRGASVHVSGNEHGNGGLLQLRAGSGSLSQIRSYTGGSERMRIDQNGNAIFTKSGGAYLQLKDANGVRGSINVTSSDGLVFTTGVSFTERFNITNDGARLKGSGSYYYANTGANSGLWHEGAFALRFGTSNTERMRIDSGGGVIFKGALASHQTNAGAIEYFSNQISLKAYGATSGTGLFTIHTGGGGGSAGSERLRIDSSGNVLVGKTASGVSNNGAELRNGSSNHAITATSDSEIPILVNRKTNDGDIIKFYKDGSTVGSIGTANDDLFIGTTNGSDQCYLRFAFGGVGMVPATSAGLANDNALDLGASNARFKDLYLGGDANIDGDVGIGATSITSGFKTEISGGFLRVGDTQGEDAVEMGWFAGGNRGFIQVYDRGDSAFRDLLINDSLMIESDGDVGIGTTSPVAKFEVSDGSSSITLQEFNNGATIFLDGSNGDFIGGDYFHIIADGVGYLGLGGYGGGATPLNINFQGNVGVGTNSPDTNLHIYDASGGATLKIASNTANAYDSSKIQMIGGNLSTSEILLGDASDSDIGRIIYRHNGNSLAFDVNAEERLRIDSSGNVGIGNSDPQNTLHLGDESATSAGTLRIDSFVAGQFWKLEPGTNTLNVKDYGGTSLISFDGANNYVLMNGGNVGIGTASPVSLLHLENASSPTVRIKDTTNNVTLLAYAQDTNAHIGTYSNHDLIFDSNSTERMRVLSSGGVTFNGDTATANALDDYEEGTFTPTIHAGASNIVAHSNNYGKYTKVGNVVHCSGRFQSTSLTPGSSSTNVEIGGLPFSAVASGLSNGTGAIAGSIGFAGGFSGEAPTAMQIRQNEPNAFLYYQNASLSFSNLKGDDFSSGSNTIVFQITYQTS